MIGFSKTYLPSLRRMAPKPQASTSKSWPKKEDTFKVTFKDHSKPKVEEKGKLITNPTRYFKCNEVGHIAINYPTKRSLVFSEDLNDWIKKSDDDCQEGIVHKDEIKLGDLKDLKVQYRISSQLPQLVALDHSSFFNSKQSCD
ncbi:hypothetical protein M9H77_17793 [Catharanthus roseus]|uniref:Uncharacterized protein n=1 Tax=Catharanthus roseus TaxID=4058 RepID=A0ACC0B5K7_CATRO|nr:hypothetical protein M9H77_17793 [Catharanthus roseus]